MFEDWKMSWKYWNEIDQLKNQQQRSDDTDSSISFKILKEIVKVYDGGNNFNVWLSQLLNVQKNFKVGDDMMRALIHYKVKGDAEI